MRILIPSSITFISLICGMASILCIVLGILFPAGVLIIACYILDMFDGMSARKLKVASDFGLQLDSLVDVISLGVAPALLAFQHLRDGTIAIGWIWLFVTLVVMAGTFRLARFNLLPAKEKETQDSLGLTISTSGATITVAVLADLSWPNGLLADPVYLLIMGLVIILMVSTIRFPTIPRMLSNRVRAIVILMLIALSLLVMPVFVTWFVWDLIYIVAGLLRAAYKRLRRGRET
jgi:CDP-diacylglycerol--serine O-phosphatidyltransferase